MLVLFTSHTWHMRSVIYERMASPEARKLRRARKKRLIRIQSCTEETARDEG